MNSFRKDLVLSYGPIQTLVNLHTVKKPSQRAQTRSVCPEHNIPLKQRLFCTECNHNVDNPAKFVDTNAGWREVVRGSEPKEPSEKALSMTLVPAEELAGFVTLGNQYYCEPSSEHFKAQWVILRDAIKSGKYAFVLKGVLRSGPKKLYRLVVHNNYLMLEELEFPENLKDALEPVDHKVDKETRDLFAQFLKTHVGSVDDLDLADESTRVYNEWAESGKPVEMKKDEGLAELTDAVASVKSLQDLLRESIAS